MMARSLIGALQLRHDVRYGLLILRLEQGLPLLQENKSSKHNISWLVREFLFNRKLIAKGTSSALPKESKRTDGTAQSKG